MDGGRLTAELTTIEALTHICQFGMKPNTCLQYLLDYAILLGQAGIHQNI